MRSQRQRTHRVTLLHRNGNVTIRGRVNWISTFADKSVSLEIDTPEGERYFWTNKGEEVDRVIVVPEE